MSRPRRFRWNCPTCGAHGYGLSPAEARDEGIAHYLGTHQGQVEF